MNTPRNNTAIYEANLDRLIKIKAIINVFPEDRSRIKKKKKPYEEQTIVGNVSKDFTYLYSSFVRDRYGISLIPPPFGAHVTIHNGKESIPNIEKHLDYLKSLQNKQITLYCNPTFYLYWRFFAISCYSPELDLIREKLGLVKKSFHITIGQIKEEDVTLKPVYSLSEVGKHICVEINNLQYQKDFFYE